MIQSTNIFYDTENYLFQRKQLSIPELLIVTGEKMQMILSYVPVLSSALLMERYSILHVKESMVKSFKLMIVFVFELSEGAFPFTPQRKGR